MRRFIWLLALLAAPALAQPGALDATFGVGGLVVGPIPRAGADDVIIDAMDRVVVSGTAATVGGGFGPFVARYTEEGATDLSFATAGISFYRDDSNGAAAGPLVQLADGGYLTLYYDVSGWQNYTRRVTEGGSLAAGCHMAGGIIEGMQVSQDGDVVFSIRNRLYLADTYAMVAKMTMDSEGAGCAPAMAFGTDGFFRFAVPDRYSAIMDLAIQPDGRIVAVGWVQTGISAIPTQRQLMFAMRLTPEGQLDPTFGYDGAGYVIFDPTGLDTATAWSVALGPDGAIILAGMASNYTTGGNTGLRVVRLRYDGIPDTAFGTAGSVFLSSGVYAGMSYAVNVSIDSANRIVVGGTSGTAWVFTRLQSETGAVDPTFGSQGTSVVELLGLPARLAALTLLPDGRIVAAGTVGQYEEARYVVARLNSDGGASPNEPAPASLSSLRVWPNPAAGAARLDLTLETAGDVRAALYDVMGRQVADLGGGAHAAGSVRLALDLASVAPGVYVVRVETPDGVATQRIVVR